MMSSKANYSLEINLTNLTSNCKQRKLISPSLSPTLTILDKFKERKLKELLPHQNLAVKISGRDLGSINQSYTSSKESSRTRILISSLTLIPLFTQNLLGNKVDLRHLEVSTPNTSKRGEE